MLEQIFAALEVNVAGADIGTLRTVTGATSSQLENAIQTALATGALERWPFWPQRIRAMGPGATPFLAELAGLRQRALAVLGSISAASGWPATLHILVPGAHAVVERLPWHADPEEAQEEQRRYARPRALTTGATAMAIVAYLPADVRDAFLTAHSLHDWRPGLASIREQGYCFRGGAEVVGSSIVSAALLSSDGSPFGALCTYGYASPRDPHWLQRTARGLRDGADALSRLPPGLLVDRADAIIRGLPDLVPGHVAP